MRVAMLAALALLCTSCAIHHLRIATPGGGWVDLRPQTQLKIENAYFQAGTQKFLGTEVARYQVRPRRGLRLVSVEPGQRPVQDLIPPSQRGHSRYRYFYAVVFKKNGAPQGSVLLGAGSVNELDRITEQLNTDPDAVCGAKSRRCTVFPKSSTVALEMEVVVNGSPRTILWGSVLASIAGQHQHIALLRLEAGRPAPVEITPDVLRLPLLPGDQINWD